MKQIYTWHPSQLDRTFEKIFHKILSLVKRFQRRISLVIGCIYDHQKHKLKNFGQVTIWLFLQSHLWKGSFIHISTISLFLSYSKLGWWVLPMVQFDYKSNLHSLYPTTNRISTWWYKSVSDYKSNQMNNLTRLNQNIWLKPST